MYIWWDTYLGLFVLWHLEKLKIEIISVALIVWAFIIFFHWLPNRWLTLYTCFASFCHKEALGYKFWVQNTMKSSLQQMVIQILLNWGGCFMNSWPQRICALFTIIPIVQKTAAKNDMMSFISITRYVTMRLLLFYSSSIMEMINPYKPVAPIVKRKPKLYFALVISMGLSFFLESQAKQSQGWEISV